jgi:hypothetical protein
MLCGSMLTQAPLPARTPLAALQVAQTVVAQAVESLVDGSITLEQFDDSTDTASVREAIEGASLEGVLLPEGFEAPSDDSKALAIGLGVGLGVGIPLLAAAVYLAWAYHVGRAPFAKKPSQGLQEPWVVGGQAQQAPLPNAAGL